MSQRCRHLSVAYGPLLKVWICRWCGRVTDVDGPDESWREPVLSDEQRREHGEWLARNREALRSEGWHV
jgi:hypothetical protein